MANELGIRVVMDFVKSGSSEVHIDTFTKYFDVTGEIAVQSSLSVGITKENISKPTDMGTIGYVFLWNRDSTNFVEFGDDADGPSIKLLAGEFGMFRWGATNVSAKADTAACVVEYALIEA